MGNFLSKNRVFILILAFIFITAVLSSFAVFKLVSESKAKQDSQTISIKTVNTEILANGSIHSENEAVLHFQTGGKLVYLPLKEGDKVYAGQTIANLDTYALNLQLSSALNTYRITRDNFDQANDNSANNILQGQQKFALETQSRTSIGGDTENNIIDNIVKRILDQNQANLDNSVINVELANYALQLSSLTSPINGIILHEDVKIPNQNITPSTSFTVIDPDMPVFRANVLAQDIDFINVGAVVHIKLNSSLSEITGTVERIYPEKLTLSTGEQVYQVDIQSPDLKETKYGENGNVLIQNNTNTNTTLIPTWTVLGHTSVWVKVGNNIILKNVKVGKTHGNYIEILSGLDQSEKIILDPKSVIGKDYSVL